MSLHPALAWATAAPRARPRVPVFDPPLKTLPTGLPVPRDEIAHRRPASLLSRLQPGQR